MHVRVEWDTTVSKSVIRRSASGAPGEVIAVVADATTYDDHDVAPGQTYAYTVSAATEGAESAPTAPESILIPDGDADADFIARRNAPGVLRWYGFDSKADLGGTDPGVSDPVTLQGAMGPPEQPWNWPDIDPNIKASGAAALELTVSGGLAYATQEYGAGVWSANFTPSPGGQPTPFIPIGANGSLFVQTRVRWDGAMCEHVWLDQDGVGHITGAKIFDVVAGDRNGKVYGSSSDAKVVVATLGNSRVLQVYQYFPGGINAGMYDKSGGVYHIQNADIPACVWPDTIGDPPMPTPACFCMPPDEFVTLQLGITLGAPGVWDYSVNGSDHVGPVDAWPQSTIRLWATRDGGPTQLILDMHPGLPGYAPLLRPKAEAPDPGEAPWGHQVYGRVNLMCHMTRMGSQQTPGDGHVHYDELIIGTKRIPDPAYTAAGSGGNPILAAIPANTLLALPDVTATVPPGEDPLLVGGMGVYSRLLYDRTRRRVFLFGGGHFGTNYDGFAWLGLDDLKWGEEYKPGSAADYSQADTRYDRTLGAWKSGSGTGPYPRPAARHVESGMHIRGDELILTAKVEGNGISGIAPPFPSPGEFYLACAARCAHYNMTAKTWKFSSSADGFTNYPGQAPDPASDKIVSLGQQGLESYDPVTMMKALHVNLGSYAGLTHLVTEDLKPIAGATGALMGYNNSLVYFPGDQKFYYFEHLTAKVWRIDLDRGNFANSRIVRLDSVTGTPPPTTHEVGFAYDEKNQVMVGALIDNVIHVFDPLLLIWKRQTVLGGVPGITMSSQCIAYDPESNTHIINQAYNGAVYSTMWAYKYKP